jgi:hypothetical protein
MELGPDYMGMWVVWEKFRFQTPDYIHGICCGIWTHVVVEQKNPLGQPSSAILR